MSSSSQVNPYFKDALNLADLMNMKMGTVVYCNHTHLYDSKKYVFSHLDLNKSIVIFISLSSFDERYYAREYYLQDCGVVPYVGDNGRIYFNESNYLSFEPACKNVIY